MAKRPMRFFMALSLIVAGGLAACDGSNLPSAPQEPGDASGALRLVTKRGAATGGGESMASAVSLQSSMTQVVGAGGGQLNLGGHSLLVPAGAVDSDTEFTFAVGTGEYILVELHAVRVSDGAVVSAFPVDLTLRLSYAEADIQDPNVLLNAYLVQGTTDGALQPLPSTVDTATLTVSSPISHFSIYAMAMD